MAKEVLRTDLPLPSLPTQPASLAHFGVISWPSAVAVFLVGLLIMMPDLMVVRLASSPRKFGRSLDHSCWRGGCRVVDPAGCLPSSLIKG